VPAPDRLLTLIQQAKALTRATPGRVGHILNLDARDCTELLVVGDLHGRVAHVQVILKTADLPNNPTRHIVFQELIHGKFRYPKGGDKSHQVVDLFAALKCQFPKQVHYIPGNHELAQWSNRPVLKGNENVNALFEEGVSEAYGKEWGPKIYAAYLELFQTLPAIVRAPNRVVISHTIPSNRLMPTFDPTRLEADTYDPEDFQPGGTLHSLLWGRDTARETVKAFLEKVDGDLLVCGHIACEKGYATPHDCQLILDCAENPGGFVLFPTRRRMTLADMMHCIRII
jgi:hypothetical protein